MNLLRDVALALSMAGLLSTGARAQAPARFEIGTRAGMTILNNSGSRRTGFNVPGAGPLGVPVLQFTAIPQPRLLVEVQGSFSYVSSGSSSGHSLLGVLRVGGFLRDPDSSPYLFADGTAASVSGGTTTPKALGGGIGYRALVGHNVVLRPEFGYRKWTDNGPSEFTLALAFGVQLPQAK